MVTPLLHSYHPYLCPSPYYCPVHGLVDLVNRGLVDLVNLALVDLVKNLCGPSPCLPGPLDCYIGGC